MHRVLQCLGAVRRESLCVTQPQGADAVLHLGLPRSRALSLLSATSGRYLWHSCAGPHPLQEAPAAHLELCRGCKKHHTNHLLSCLHPWDRWQWSRGMRTPERCSTSVSLLAFIYPAFHLQIPHSLIPFQVQSWVGILKESVPLSCLLFLSGHSCHLKAAKQRANGGSGVIQVVGRDQNCSIVSGSHQPTMKQKRVMTKPLLGLSSCLHSILSLLSITLLSDQSSCDKKSRIFKPLWTQLLYSAETALVRQWC